MQAQKEGFICPLGWGVKIFRESNSLPSNKSGHIECISVEEYLQPSDAEAGGLSTCQGMPLISGRNEKLIRDSTGGVLSIVTGRSIAPNLELASSLDKICLPILVGVGSSLSE